MKKTKIKGKIISLLSVYNGKPERITALGKSTCKKCEKEIAGGEVCFCITVAKSGHPNQKRHCASCFKEILDKTKKELNEAYELIEKY